MSSTEVLIIGAGPFGLSISAHLHSLGVQHLIVGRPLDTWRAHMPEGMCLASCEGFPSNFVSHTIDHHKLDHFKGRSVAVVGLGQSAIETAAFLHEQGAEVCTLWNTLAAYRLLPLNVKMTKTRTVLGPAGSWWLKNRVDGKIEVFLTIASGAPRTMEAPSVVPRWPQA